MSQETRLKISQSNKGKHNTNIGIPRPQEVKDKISQASKGRLLSEEHKQKLSIAHTGKLFSSEVKEKMSLAHFKKGYYFDKNRNKYRIRIKQKGYGSFDTEKEAQNKVREILSNERRN